MLDEIAKILAQNPIKFEKPKQEKTITLKVEPFFTVQKLDENRFQISGKKAEDFISMTNFSQPQAVQRLWGIFKKVGLEKELLKQGIQDGDIIVACGKEFEWSGADFSGEEVSNLPERLGGYKRRETKQERLEKRRSRRQEKFNL